jgi:hypothetical protein
MCRPAPVICDGLKGRRSGDWLECVDLDVDAPGEVPQRRRVGTADAGGRQQRIVERQDL